MGTSRKLDTTVRSISSSSSCRNAANKFRIPALLMIGLVVLSCLPIGAIGMPQRRQESRLARRISRPRRDYDPKRELMMKDRSEKYATYTKISNSSQSGAVAFPVTFDADNSAYLVHLNLGSPPREFALVADTGSPVVWVPCAPYTCADCGPQPVLVTNTSSTYETLSCSSPDCTDLALLPDVVTCSTSDVCMYNLTYIKGQTTGELSTDVLTAATVSGKAESFPDFGFGCSHEIADGQPLPIAGLTIDNINISLVGQVGSKVGFGFSFCFATYGDNKTTELVLGSSGTKGLSYTPLVPIEDVYYYVNVTGISVDRQLLNISTDALSINSSSGDGGVVLDTGTSFSALLDAVYYPLLQGLDSKISKKYPRIIDSIASVGLELCFDLTSFSFAPNTTLDQVGLPTVTFHFQDLDLPLPLDNTYTTFLNENSTLASAVCLIMQSGGSTGPSIFGNYQMQNHYFFFDPENSRVGIKAQQC